MSNNVKELTKYITLENLFKYGYIYESIIEDVKELQEYPNEKLSYFCKEDYYEISDHFLERTKNHPIVTPDLTINLNIPQKGTIQMLFYIYTYEEGEDDEIPLFLKESINEDIENRKKKPDILNVYSRWIIREHIRKRNLD